MVCGTIGHVRRHGVRSCSICRAVPMVSPAAIVRFYRTVCCCPTVVLAARSALVGLSGFLIGRVGCCRVTVFFALRLLGFTPTVCASSLVLLSASSSSSSSAAAAATVAAAALLFAVVAFACWCLLWRGVCAKCFAAEPEAGEVSSESEGDDERRVRCGVVAACDVAVRAGLAFLNSRLQKPFIAGEVWLFS